MHIAVSSWSYRQALYGGSLHLSDVPSRVCDLGLRYVELNDLFLAPPRPGRLARLLGARPASPSGPDYGRRSLRLLQQSRLRSGARLVCWTVETDLTVAEVEEQRAQRAYIGTAIEAARFLGAPTLRLTLGEDASGIGRAVDLLRAVVPAAVASGVRLAIENHGGLSSAAGVLDEIVGAWGTTRPVGVCLDLGHFSAGEQAEGVVRLAPLAVHVHAPFDRVDGRNEGASIDYRASLAALRDAGYDAAITIEYIGEDDPRQGILSAKSLIETHWEAP